MTIGYTTDVLKSAVAGAAITSGQILKFGADDDTLVPAAAATDVLMAIAEEAAASGQQLAVAVSAPNIRPVVLGGAVTRGDLITSDANGAGVTCAPGAGANNYYIGMAMMSGVAGDIIPVRVGPGVMQGS